MPDDLKPVLARQMEVYAGFMEHTDHHVGRLIDALAELEILEDTLVYYIVGDNGASAEGTLQGCFNEMIVLNGAGGLETTEFMVSKIDKFGTPEAYNHYAVGWAHAMDTPYQWTKQVASHWGGTRNGTIVHWPAGIQAKGEVRSQFSHVIDVAATVLDAAGLPEPMSVHGVQQMPLQGRSMVPTFDDSEAPEHRETQYFEMFVNRGIYHKGWTAVTRHSVPWVRAATDNPAYDDDVWELYGPDDWTQAHDLAAEQPDKLAELQRLFLIEATRYNVLPLDDRRFERFNPDLAGRPQLIRGNFPAPVRGDGAAQRELRGRAQEQVPCGHGAGDRAGGWGGRGDHRPGRRLRRLEPVPARRAAGVLLQPLRVAAVQDLRGAARPAGEHQLRMEFSYDGGGLGKGGDVTLYLDGDAGGRGPRGGDRADGVFG